MSEQSSLGVITNKSSARRTDYLYRISIKCLVQDDQGNVLVVKEAGRESWDLPGGGMDHGENITSAIAREMKEEVNLEGDFTHTILTIDEPAYLNAHDLWQVRLIFKVDPTNMAFSAGIDADEIVFVNPNVFSTSPLEPEQRIYRYSKR